MNNEVLSERIKTAREQIGITKAEAARRLNLSKIGYCRYEYGERTPSPQTVELIAQCFNTSVEYLSGSTDDIRPNYIIISKKNTPHMFDLVSSLQDANDDSIRRLLNYYRSIKREMDCD